MDNPSNITVDEEKAREIVDDGFEECLQLFIEQSKSIFKKNFKEGFEDKDCAKLKLASHTLKTNAK